VRILLVSAIPPEQAPGGAERVVHLLAERLAREHDVTVLSIGDEPAGAVDGYRTHRIPAPNVYRPDRRGDHSRAREYLWQVNELYPLLASQTLGPALDELGRFDVVNTHNVAGLTFEAFSTLDDHAEALVHTAHDYRLISPWVRIWDGPLPTDALPLGLYRSRVREATRPVDLFVTPSRFAGQRHEAYDAFADRPWRTIANGIPVDRYPQRGPPERPTFVCFGRLDEAKGIRAFLEAAVPRSRARFQVAGDGPDRDAIEALAECHANLEVLGYLPRDQLRERLAASTAVVVPSRWSEVFGLVAAEAMAAGVPALYAPAGGLPEVAGDSGLGVELPPRIEAMAERVAEFGRDPQPLHNQREACRAYAEQNLSVDRMAADYARVYAHAATRSVPPPTPAEGWIEPGET
jgi:glycosyltransferase involved in cell wall biosynthesis